MKINRFERVFNSDSEVVHENTKEQAPKTAPTTDNLPLAFAGDPAGFADYETDPRPDITEDHSLWIPLLFLAKSKDTLWDVFHALRCGGARLKENPVFGMTILPGEWIKAEYNELKLKYLTPNKDAVLAILKEAAKLQHAPTPEVVPTLDGWPEQAILSEERHGYPARLYHYLGQMVPTPKGEAKLLQVFDDTVTVHVPGDEQVTRYQPDVIIAHLSQIFATIKKEAM